MKYLLIIITLMFQFSSFGAANVTCTPTFPASKYTDEIYMAADVDEEGNILINSPWQLIDGANEIVGSLMSLFDGNQIVGFRVTSVQDANEKHAEAYYEFYDVNGVGQGTAEASKIAASYNPSGPEGNGTSQFVNYNCEWRINDVLTQMKTLP